MAYIKLRHRTYWAYHDIPADVRHAIGRGLKAENRKAALEVQWRREIERACMESPDAIEADAQFWPYVTSTLQTPIGGKGRLTTPRPRDSSALRLAKWSD